MNRTLKGKILLKLADSTYSSPAEFEIAPAKLTMINLDWQTIEQNDMNCYPVELIAEVEGQKYCRSQLLSVAAFARITAVIDAELNEWQNCQPVFLDSDRFKSTIDGTQYLLNPALNKPDGSVEEKRIIGKFYTGYDTRNVYLAAEIFEEQLDNHSGEVFSVNGVVTKFQQGMPSGFNHIRFNGDALLFAFGFRERVPGWGRQMNDPYAWKGHFYDSDYTYVAHVSTQGDQLVRLWGKNTGRRNAYQGAAVAGVGAVPGAKIIIRRDINAGCSIYELSIPRTEIDLFDPQSEFLRFAFLLVNDEGLGPSGTLGWPQAAGVFDYWCSSGAFGPTWQSDLPCQTFWGISK